MRPTERSSLLFSMSHRKNSNLPLSLSQPDSYKMTGFSAIRLLVFLALGLVVFLAGCSYGPTGIFAGVELERRTQSFSVGLPVVNVQRIAVSADGTRAAISGGRLYVRAGESSTSEANTNWNRVSLPTGFTNSLDVGIANDGTIYAVLIGDSGTGAFSSTDTALTAVDALNGLNVQGVLQAGDMFYFVVRNGDGTYQIRNSAGAVVLVDNLSTFPSKAVVADGNTFILTRTRIFDLSVPGTDTFAPANQTLTGLTTDGTVWFASTAQGNIYENGLLVNSSPIQVGNTTVKFTDLIYIGGNTLLAGSQGFGYFVINTTNGNATRAINRDLSNLLDTPLYNKTVSTFAYVGPAADAATTNLYLSGPGEGVFFGTRTGDFIQWNPLQE